MATPRARADEAALARAKSVTSSDNATVDSSKPLHFSDAALPVRLNTCKIGREIPVEVNIFRSVLKTDICPTIHQYDVKMVRCVDAGKPSDAATDIPRKLKEKIWISKPIKTVLGPWGIYDGNNLAWNLEKNTDNRQIEVDLGVEDGKPPAKAGSRNIFFVIITWTTAVDLKPLIDVLSGASSSGAAAKGAASWGEPMNVLDQVLHQHPKNHSTVLKKSIFSKNPPKSETERLGGGIVALRGVYAAFKIVFAGFNQANTPLRSLAINVDATCVAFLEPMPLKQIIMEVLGMRNEQQFADAFAATAKGKSDREWEASQLGRRLNLLKNVEISLLHTKDKATGRMKTVKIQKFIRLPPRAYKFEVEATQDSSGLKPGNYSVAQYFQERYPTVRVIFASLPCVQAAGNNVLPIEVCTIPTHQKYISKLTPEQTSNMLKIAAQPPVQRKAAIENGVRDLKWSSDPWLNAFGIKIQPAMMKVQARVLDCPDLTFTGKKISSNMTSKGQWDIRGAKFIRTNEVPITSWGCYIIANSRGPCVKEPDAYAFFSKFQQIYQGHGGIFKSAKQITINTMAIADLGNQIKVFVDRVTAANKKQPDICFFIVPDQSVDVYNAIKKSMDCRYGIASQVLLSKHVLKAQPQYISNVALKVNAKLGGNTCTARIASAVSATSQFYDPKERVMVLGADVTHAAAGDFGNSVACLVASKDHTLNRYMGAVEVNGFRQDIIHRDQMDTLFSQQLKTWSRVNGNQLPKRILYFRDGVSREMSKKVLDEEVGAIKAALAHEAREPKFAKTYTGVSVTVVIATKRHHTRIFPGQNGDQNQNCMPGTLVDTWVTGAVDLDWFMVSHKALKGTARPMHYHVILDENKYKMEALQCFIHESCFQFVRSTTSVSQFPAIYYAHLCARRGVIHEAKAISAQSDGKKEIDARRLEGKMTDNEIVTQARLEKTKRHANDPPLLYMDPVPGNLGERMWFA